MDSATAPRATVLITTRNRHHELAVAVESALAQSADCEVLIVDDGSTDGTSEMIRTRFPRARLIRHETSAGYIVRRNEGAELAMAPIVFSIDDDASFPSQRTVEQTLAEFNDSRIGAVAIPFINVRQDEIVRQRAPASDQIYVTESYIGTAHAIRRDLFLKLGGYRTCLFHQGEEGDYCIRMLATGHVVRLGLADPIHHFESPRRDFTRWDIFARRNDILVTWFNVPLPYLLAHLPITMFNGLRHGIRYRRVGNTLRGLGKGVLDAIRYFRVRKPVPSSVYKLSRRMRRQGNVPLADIAGELERL